MFFVRLSLIATSLLLFLSSCSKNEDIASTIPDRCLLVSGVNSKVELHQFIQEAIEAFEARDLHKIKLLSGASLRVNFKGSKAILQTQEEFEEYRSKIFAATVIDQAIFMKSKEKLAKLFCRDIGAMFGNGAVWIGSNEAGSPELIAINSDS